MLKRGLYYSRMVVLSILFTIILFISTAEGQPHEPQFSVEVQLTQPLQDGNNINFTNLFTPSGQGRMLYSFDIINEDLPKGGKPGGGDKDGEKDGGDKGEKDKLFVRFKSKPKADKLYLNIRFYTDNTGTISEIKQKDKKGFKMENGQRIHIGNQMLGRSLPGIKEKVEFEGGLTMAGQNLLNGKTMGSLPPAHYTIEVQLYQEKKKQRGGKLLTSGTADFTITAEEEQSGGGGPMGNGNDNPGNGNNGGNGNDNTNNPGGGNTGPGGNNNDGNGGSMGSGHDNPEHGNNSGNDKPGEGNTGTDGKNNNGGGGSKIDTGNPGNGNQTDFPIRSRRSKVSSIYLSTPGAEDQNGQEIRNPYPEFRWDGPSGPTYRLILVKAKSSESPESLIQGALNTAPSIIKRRSGQGKLLDYEILDAVINRPAFQFPTSGVQPLEANAKYYWQVLVDEKDSDNISDGIRSEIWSFRLAAGAQKTVAYSGELTEILKKLLGESDYRNLKRDGFRLLSININGKTLTGQAALNGLSQFVSKINQDKITLGK